MSCLAARYALMQQVLTECLEASDRGFERILAERIDLALQFAPPLSDSLEIPADDRPECGVIWGSGGFASAVYIGNGLAMTAQHVLVVSPDNAAFGIADFSEAEAHACRVLPHVCQPPAAQRVTNDIMVVRLSGNLPKTATDLASPDDFKVLLDSGGPVTVVGFGCGWPPGHPEQPTVGRKRAADLTIYTGNTDDIGHFDPNVNFVLADAEGKLISVCEKDSGGPAFATIGGRPKLVGVARGTGGAGPDGCGIAKLSVFTRVDANLNLVPHPDR